MAHAICKNDSPGKTGLNTLDNLIVLIACFSAGLMVRNLPAFQYPNQILNSYVIYVALPALVFSSFRKLVFVPSKMLIAVMPWIMFLGAALFFSFFFRKDKKLFACVLVCAGLANTSFVGIPVVEAFYGKELIPLAVIADQFGTFFILSFPGIMILQTVASDERVSKRKLVYNLLKFPPFIAVLITAALLPMEIPPLIVNAAERMGDSLTPVALFSVGLRMKFVIAPEYKKPLLLGLLYKLILAPLLISTVFALIQAEPDVRKVAVLESAASPMITAAILAMEKNVHPELAESFLSLGIPLSFLTMFAWKISGL